MANSNELREAFQKLELLVTLDILPNETGSLAHYMLPCTSPLERPDLPFIFPLMLGMQTKPYLQATEKILETTHEQRDEATIYWQLCQASGVNIFDSALAQRAIGLLLKKEKGKQPALNNVKMLNFFIWSLANYAARAGTIFIYFSSIIASRETI